MNVKHWDRYNGLRTTVKVAQKESHLEAPEIRNKISKPIEPSSPRVKTDILRVVSEKPAIWVKRCPHRI